MQLRSHESDNLQNLSIKELTRTIQAHIKAKQNPRMADRRNLGIGLHSPRNEEDEAAAAAERAAELQRIKAKAAHQKSLLHGHLLHQWVVATDHNIM